MKLSRAEKIRNAQREISRAAAHLLVTSRNTMLREQTAGTYELEGMLEAGAAYGRALDGLARVATRASD